MIDLSVISMITSAAALVTPMVNRWLDDRRERRKEAAIDRREVTTKQLEVEGQLAAKSIDERGTLVKIWLGEIERLKTDVENLTKRVQQLEEEKTATLVENVALKHELNKARQTAAYFHKLHNDLAKKWNRLLEALHLKKIRLPAGYEAAEIFPPIVWPTVPPKRPAQP